MNKDILRAVGLGKQVDMVENGLCPTCGKKIDHKGPNGFRDELSLREFGISGMCQVCQDQVFNSEEE